MAEYRAATYLKEIVLEKLKQFDGHVHNDTEKERGQVGFGQEAGSTLPRFLNGKWKNLHVRLVGKSGETVSAGSAFRSIILR